MQHQATTAARSISNAYDECHGMSASELLQPAIQMSKDPAVELVLKAAGQRVLRNFYEIPENFKLSRCIVINGLEETSQELPPVLENMCPSPERARRRVPEIRIFRIDEPDPRRSRLVNSIPKKQRLLWCKPHKRRVDLQIVDFWDASMYYYWLADISLSADVIKRERTILHHGAPTNESTRSLTKISKSSLVLLIKHDTFYLKSLALYNVPSSSSGEAYWFLES